MDDRTDIIMDLERETRTGFPEAIYGGGKTIEQSVRAFTALVKRGGKALATRCSREALDAISVAHPGTFIHELAGVAVFPAPARREAAAARSEADAAVDVAVLAAGTSDLPIAEEAALTLEFSGFVPDRLFDVGIAGIHRLFERLDRVHSARVVIVCAGMEGALPSIVGGLSSVPIIAVPTSVGYGANFQGLSALLAMLNSCAPGVTVVNIDNGFGAAVAAIRILRQISRLA
jgi:pyridinium-3,5-biscarboxylic acid mononucleotide synthase